MDASRVCPSDPPVYRSSGVKLAEDGNTPIYRVKSLGRALNLKDRSPSADADFWVPIPLESVWAIPSRKGLGPPRALAMLVLTKKNGKPNSWLG